MSALSNALHFLLTARSEYATRRILSYRTGPLPVAFRSATMSTDSKPIVEASSSGPSLVRRIIHTRPGTSSKSSTPATPVSSTGSARPLLPPPRSQALPSGRPSPRLRPRVAPPPAKATAAVPSPKQPKPIPDPEGYYRALEIPPTSRMTDVAEARKIDISLKEKWRALQTMYHADKAFGTEQGPKMAARSKRINVAYSELKTRAESSSCDARSLLI